MVTALRGRAFTTTTNTATQSRGTHDKLLRQVVANRLFGQSLIRGKDFVSAVAPPKIASRPLPARRADLVVREQRFQGRTAYFVKDPLTLRYFRFAAPEFRLFELLDGRRSAAELRTAYLDDLASDEVAIEDIVRLVGRWKQAGLLEDLDAVATTRTFVSRQQQRERTQWFGWLSQWLYWKVRAIDPDTLLNRTLPWVRWMFHPLGVAAALCLMLSAALLIIGRFDQFAARPELQSFHAFFNLQNIVWLWLAVGVVKVLHEFGHALACKHFGGECHAMGLLFMCFTPCLYCDVSDSWMLPNKWHRIAIAAAGIYVEVLIASLATFVWWSTPPGVLHSLAFSAMLFGSVQTFLINANPLMKFDGYYALSDFLEVPNLRQKSYAMLRHYATKWCWGTDAAAPGPTGLNGVLFTLYAIAATVYGWMVTVLMVWFLTKFLQPYKLTVVGWGLALLAAINIFVVPLAVGLVAVRRNPSVLRPKPWWRPVLATAVLAAIVWAVLFVPLPHRVYAVLTIEPTHSEQVSVIVPGRILKIFVQPGQFVSQGDPLLELDNVELREQNANLEQERELFQVQLRVAEASVNPARSQQLRVLIEAVDSQLALQQRRLADLRLRAPCDGTVVPEPEHEPLASRGSPHETQLARWAHSPLNREGVGAVLDAGTPVCRIVESPEYEAVAILPQTQIESVRVGQAVTIKLDAFPDDMLLGIVREIGVQNVTNPPPQLLNVAGSELPAVTFGPGAGTLATPHYQVRLSLTGFDRMQRASSLPPLRVGLRGRVWIRAGSQTMALRWWHWLCEAFQS